MASFKQHEPCPDCGSRNNLGRYTDGSAWCFGCGYREKATHAPARVYTEMADDAGGYPKIPDDSSRYIGQPGVEWLAKYGVEVPEAIERGLVWSESKQQLIFRWPQDSLWQARNFGAWAKSKNFTSGEINVSNPIYSCSGGGSPAFEPIQEGTIRRQLVIPEDPLSALRIARQSDAMPLLGSHLATDRLNRIAWLKYDQYVLWLDSDKYKESCAIAQRLKLLGLSCRVIYTELDPKEYSDAQIKEYLK